MIHRRSRLLWNCSLALIAVLLYCEFLVYYFVLSTCSYPKLKTESSPDTTLRVMFLADTHLLGPRLGHPWDKLRREWQMHRAFQTAQTLFKPELVVFLGDLFDEGKWSTEEQFTDYVRRFDSLFYVDRSHTEVRVVVGNHDIGFHYAVTPEMKRRFEEAFGVKSVDRFAMKGIHFVSVNSMAMEGDGCDMCQEAKWQLGDIKKQLRCMEAGSEGCELDYEPLNAYSQPVLLQHFPLYRKSDSHCDEEDEAPADEKGAKFRLGMDCLLKDASQELLQVVKPRLVMSGHTHHGCKTTHKFKSEEQFAEVDEWSVSSFSWRNRNNPTFILATMSPSEIRLEKCFLPQEDTVVQIYVISGLLILAYVIKQLCRC